jgi:hypothetical protein
MFMQRRTALYRSLGGISPVISGISDGGRDKIRTCDPYDVNVVL